MYDEIESIPNLPELEKKIADEWETLGIVEKLKELRKDAKERVYFDGPITANNMPHYGHAIAWTLKDIVPRYWTMRGYYVSRNMGWDCQGLPVEIEVEKELGFKNNDDVEKFGIAKFNDLCRQSVLKYRDMILNYEKRMGRWIDAKDTYYTMDTDFIESMWWSFKVLYDKGLIFEDYKVVPYSVKAETTLSHQEVDEGGYISINDPAITVKFLLKDFPDTYVLAWTTTPWTIPGNLLLAVGKKINYVKVEHHKNFYILAEARVEDVFKDKEYKIVENIPASKLVDLEYIAPFNYYESKRSEGCFKIVYADHANDQDGTGIVHLAPYGEEDFDVFLTLGIKIFDYLDAAAKFKEEIPEYNGIFYKDANEQIMNDLDSKDRLFARAVIEHRVPICWRTGLPLIYRPIKSWYVAVSKLRTRMLEENQRINWTPKHMKDGMSKQWLANARDWSVSRNRYWGTPMPVWINDKTAEMFVAGSFKDIEDKSGIKITDPHRPYIDEITWEDENGGVYRRVKDVIDVWYDSGSVPFAKLHYPFENKELLDNGTKYPAEYVAEGLDQVRLWFYTMHVLGVALFDKIPYLNVVVNGMMTDEYGEKLSKSKKNYPPMDKVLENYGADILRLFVLTSPIVQGESARFYDEALSDIKKEFFLPLWNTLRYFLTYANANNWKPQNLNEPVVNDVLDKWVLARLKQLTSVMVENMDNYTFMNAARSLVAFVQDLSTWYLRRSRDRIRTGDVDAFMTINYVLVSLARLCAPFTPFLAETFYKTLKVKEYTGLDSVHMDMYQEVAELTSEEQEILNRMHVTRDVVSLALAVRSANGLKVRQPLSTIFVSAKSSDTNVVAFEDLIKDEVNVKEVKYEASDLPTKAEDNEFTVYLDTNLTKELELEGDARELIRGIQDARKKAGLHVSDFVKVNYVSSPQLEEVLKQFGDLIKEKGQVKEFVVGSEFGVEKV